MGRRQKQRCRLYGQSMMGFVASICLCIAWVAPTWADLMQAITLYRQGRYTAVYREVLPLAEAGVPQAQVFIGFLLYEGNGVPQDREQSHEWFHRAAAQGEALALYNLGVMHATGSNAIPRDYTEANLAFTMFEVHTRKASINSPIRRTQSAISKPLWPEDFKPVIHKGFKPETIGRNLFVFFCSGCHGLEGLAAYPLAPSFALGERLFKDDPALLESVLNGKGPMPPWRNKLTEEQLRKAIGFLRTLPLRAKYGLPVTRPPNGMILRFRPRGEPDDDWWRVEVGAAR